MKGLTGHDTCGYLPLVLCKYFLAGVEDEEFVGHISGISGYEESTGIKPVEELQEECDGEEGAGDVHAGDMKTGVEEKGGELVQQAMTCDTRTAPQVEGVAVASDKLAPGGAETEQMDTE